MADLPAPLTPSDCDLRDFPFMPLEVTRLRRSKAWLKAKRNPEIGFYMLNLWCASWHERPAGSLEDDDDVLADLAMCDPERWEAVREEVLRGWVKCSDGRLYHPVVVEKVMNAWDQKQAQRQRTEAARQAKAQNRHKERERVIGVTTASVTETVGIPTEPDDAAAEASTASKGEGEGEREKKEISDASHPHPGEPGSGGVKAGQNGNPSEPEGLFGANLPAVAPQREPALVTTKGRVRNGTAKSLAGFDDFYRQYPNKQDVGAAEKAWPKAVQAAGGDPAPILMGLLSQRHVLREQHARGFCKHPATWLNAKGWLNALPGEEDDPAPERPGTHH